MTHVFAHIVTTSIDPAELFVRRRKTGRMGGFLRTVFDCKKHSHVIENHYCNLCEVNMCLSVYLPVRLSISLCLTAGLNCDAVAEIHSTQCFGHTAFFRFVVVQVCCVVSVPEMKCMLWLVPCSNHS